jgi:hypothetical protein
VNELTKYCKDTQQIIYECAGRTKLSHKSIHWNRIPDLPNTIPALLTGTRKLDFTRFRPEFTRIKFSKNLFYSKSVY